MVKAKKLVPLRILRNRLWDKISLYVRWLGADTFRETNVCFTCERVFPIKDLQCGHFLHGKLDFDLRNLKPQCQGCNHYKGGNRILYALKLVRIYGLEWVDQLKHDADVKGNYYTRLEMEELMQKYGTKP